MLTAAPQQYWDELYRERSFAYEEEAVPFKDVFARFLPKGESCFEVGCFPGAILIYLNRHFGYRANGIDATPGAASTLRPFLEAHGVQVGSLYHGDFFNTDI
jgi:hypothetical protein